jgi:hypothetical protein
MLIGDYFCLLSCAGPTHGAVPQTERPLLETGLFRGSKIGEARSSSLTTLDSAHAFPCLGYGPMTYVEASRSLVSS